ncbi:MAG: hypothetical protein JXQ75_18815 [Phycisphaerae bacterium]|nr:hypothetical protein [Phycisphaerae bacterium]
MTCFSCGDLIKIPELILRAARTCPSCGHEVKAGAYMCGFCGARLTQTRDCAIPGGPPQSAGVQAIHGAPLSTSVKDSHEIDEFGWEITTWSGGILKPKSVEEVREWLLMKRISLDDQCFNREGFEEWRTKPDKKKSKEEKNMTEASFRGPIRTTLGKEEFAILVLFAPTAAWCKRCFKIGTLILWVPAMLWGLLWYIPANMIDEFGVLGGLLTTALLYLSTPTIVGPFIVSAVAAAIAGHPEEPFKLAYAYTGSVLGTGLAAVIVGGLPGYLTGLMIGSTRPKPLR